MVLDAYRPTRIPLGDRMEAPMPVAASTFLAIALASQSPVIVPADGKLVIGQPLKGSTTIVMTPNGRRIHFEFSNGPTYQVVELAVKRPDSTWQVMRIDSATGQLSLARKQKLSD